MKNKILSIIFLFVVFLAFCFCAVEYQKPVFHKVLDVVEADKFYIDLNDNGAIDKDELFKIKDITAFSPIKKYSTEQTAQELGLTLEQYLKNGFLTRKWAWDNLLYKNVSITTPLKKYNEALEYRYVKVNYDNNDLGELLLKNGLAYIDNNSDDFKYLQTQNIKQSKSNANELSALEFLIINNKNNIAHKLNCEYARFISNGTVILSGYNKNYTPCKICFNSSNKKIKNKKSKHDLEFESFKIPKNKNIYKDSIYRKFNNIELFLINPVNKKLPNSTCNTDICRAIVREINLSKTSIDVALYGIGDQKAVIDALKSAKDRGVNIRAVVDYSVNTETIYPLTKQFISDFGAVEDSRNSLMHNKFFIFDNKKVLTGSANLSSTDTGGYNANLMVLVNSSLLANKYKEEFEQMYQKKFSNSKSKIESSKIKISDNIYACPYFSPKSDVFNSAFLPLIRSSKTEVFVSIFYLTDKKIISELLEAKARGVNVLVLIDALGAINFKDRIKLLRNAKIPVIIENWGGKNHEKTMLVDSRYLLLGSSNFSNSGFNKNNENILVIENEEIAELYRDYYLYLFNSIDKKYLKFFPRAEGKESGNSCYDRIDNNFDGKIDKDDIGCN